MRSQACFLVIACVVALPLAACGRSSSPDVTNSGDGWRRTQDGYVQADSSNGFRSITRCWSLGDGLMDYCERVGRLIESGSWAALTSNHWTGPNTTAADVASLAS